jgi:hypothetical protein
MEWSPRESLSSQTISGHVHLHFFLSVSHCHDFSAQHFRQYRKAWLSFYFSLSCSPLIPPSTAMKIATVNDLVRYVGEFM